MQQPSAKQTKADDARVTSPAETGGTASTGSHHPAAILSATPPSSAPAAAGIFSARHAIAPRHPANPASPSHSTGWIVMAGTVPRRRGPPCGSETAQLGSLELLLTMPPSLSSD